MTYRRPQKRQITLRIDADVLDAYRAHGRGYQTLMNDVLRAGLRKRDKVRVRWSEAEDDYLRTHYPARGGTYCALHLGRSVRAIHHRASTIGVGYDDDEHPEMTPERLHRGDLRESLHGRRTPISELVSLDELRAAYRDDGESGMYCLVSNADRGTKDK